MTKGSHVVPMLCAALFSLAACQPAEQAGTTAQSSGQARATSALSAVDTTFINTAGRLGLEEVRFAQLAEAKASNPAVHHFATTMAADHAAINQQLAALAESKGMAPPSNSDGRHETLYRQLEFLNGPAFDHAYMDGQMQDLTMLIQAFQTAADSGSNPQVRSFAQQGLPMVQPHLQMALALTSSGF